MTCVVSPGLAWLIKRTGAKLVTIPSQRIYPELPDARPDVPPILTIYSSLLAQAAEVLPQALKSIDPSQVDCVVYDAMSIWARGLAAHLGKPAIGIRVTFAATITCNVFKEQSRPDLGRSIVDLDHLVRSLAHARRRLESVTGVPLGGSMWSVLTHRAPTTIVLAPKDLQPSSDRFTEGFLFAGPAFVGDPPRFPPQRGDNPCASWDNRYPVVYVSLGTSELTRMVGIYRLCLDALRSLSVRVVLAYGQLTSSAPLDPLPPNVTAVQNAPQVEVLKKSQLFISHGGFLGCMEAAYYRVPALVLPLVQDNELTARAIESAGAGIRLDASSTTPGEVRQAITELLSGRFKGGTEELSNVVRVCGGYAQAADSIAECATILGDQET